jgi:hypothetical protein
LVLAVGTASFAGAQAVPGRFQIGPRLGGITFDDASAIEQGPLLGVDATYFLTSTLGVGVSIGLSRPETDGAFFPAEMSFGDTTFVYQVSQPLTIFTYSAQAVINLPLGPLQPFATAGLGQYRIYLDPQATNGAPTVDNFMFNIGAGLTLKVGQSSGFRFEVRNFVFANYDLNRISPVASRFAPRRFPDVVQIPDRTCYDQKCTLNNIQFAVGFSFVPGAGL